MRPRSNLRAFFAAVVLLLSSAPARGEPESGVAPSNATSRLPAAEELKACLKLAASPECLDLLYRESLKTASTRDALADIRRLEAVDPELRRDCHPIVHAIGRETFRLKGTVHDAFSACDQTCHSGCYHGAVERFLRGEELYAQAGRHPSQGELREKAASACNPDEPARVRFQCLHGLGHALMFFSRYRLQAALEACDGLSDSWSQQSCYGGVFMENLSAEALEQRNPSAHDYHYPCNSVADRYRRECYLMQTSRMVEMGAGMEELFRECERAGEHREACVQSIGRDLSNDVRAGSARRVAEKCAAAPAADRRACTRGVVYALIDNTWDARYALPFCASFSHAADRRSCAGEAFAYLKSSLDKTPDEIRSECFSYWNEREDCAEIGPP